MKTIIIGGVAGGATAAARLRRLDEKAEIIILERGEYVSFANCGLPYYIGGVITDREDLTLQTPESFKARFNIDFRVLNEAVKINPDTKTVTVKDLRTGEIYEETYDNLILSMGAEPIRPNIEGADGGKRKKFNVYAETKEQCEIKLAEMIERVKAGIAEEKAKPKEGALIGALKYWFEANKEELFVVECFFRVGFVNDYIPSIPSKQRRESSAPRHIF